MQGDASSTRRGSMVGSAELDWGALAATVLCACVLLVVCVTRAEPPARTSSSPARRLPPGVLEKWAPQAEPRAWKYIVLHHSATESGSVASIDAAHKQRIDAAGLPWRGVGYHFVIGNGDGMDDGAIEPTFRWKEQCDGAHAGVPLFNQVGVGICLIGDFEDAPPSPAQMTAARQLIHALQDEYGIEDDCVLVHRNLKPTACPGTRFPLAELVRKDRSIQPAGGRDP